MADLNEVIRAALAAATPGPWKEVCGIAKHYVASLEGAEELGLSLQEMHPHDGREVPAHANAVLIANAPTWLAALVAEIDQQGGGISRMKLTDMIPIPLVIAQCWADDTRVKLCYAHCEFEALCAETTQRILETEVEG